MSVINPANTLDFKTTDSLFARVRKRLRSFNAAGVLDEGDWYYYVKEVLERLGVATYKEAEAVLVVKDFKAPLPEDFSTLYAAYKCTPSMGDSKQTVFPQTGFVMYLEETCQPYKQDKCCVYAEKEVYGDKITTRFVIEGQPVTMHLDNPFLLELAGNVQGVCDSKCANLRVQSPKRISLTKSHVYTNFNDDSIYIKYFAFPKDKETGLPLIPDNTYIEKAIETCIIYNVFSDFFINGEVPDLDRKYAVVKAEYDEALKQALYYVKQPSFQTVINKIRRDRKNLDFYQI
jgi:hypothetical protein